MTIPIPDLWWNLSILLSSRLRLKVIYNEIAILTRKPPKRGTYGC
jgi:hypothetical protein